MELGAGKRGDYHKGAKELSSDLCCLAALGEIGMGTGINKEYTEEILTGGSRGSRGWGLGTPFSQLAPVKGLFLFPFVQW